MGGRTITHSPAFCTACFSLLSLARSRLQRILQAAGASLASCCALPRFTCRMIDIPERELPAKGWAGSQRPSRASLLEELRRVPGGADPALLECMARGAAFHHAGASFINFINAVHRLRQQQLCLVLRAPSVVRAAVAGSTLLQR